MTVLSFQKYCIPLFSTILKKFANVSAVTIFIPVATESTREGVSACMCRIEPKIRGNIDWREFQLREGKASLCPIFKIQRMIQTLLRISPLLINRAPVQRGAGSY